MCKRQVFSITELKSELTSQNLKTKLYKRKQTKRKTKHQLMKHIQFKIYFVILSQKFGKGNK